jgi:ribonuclease inhibitor
MSKRRRGKPAKRCVINGRQRSKHSVLARLARDLGFPEHFGHNLDALFDCLTTDIEGPVEIVWRPTQGSRAAMGRDFDELVAALRDADQVREDLTFELS